MKLSFPQKHDQSNTVEPPRCNCLQYAGDSDTCPIHSRKSTAAPAAGFAFIPVSGGAVKLGVR